MTPHHQGVDGSVTLQGTQVTGYSICELLWLGRELTTPTGWGRDGEGPCRRVVPGTWNIWPCGQRLWREPVAQPDTMFRNGVFGIPELTFIAVHLAGL